MTRQSPAAIKRSPESQVQPAPFYSYENNPNYNLTTVMADEAISYMNRMNALSADKPFLIKYVPAATSSPGPVR